MYIAIYVHVLLMEIRKTIWLSKNAPEKSNIHSFKITMNLSLNFSQKLSEEKWCSYYRCMYQGSFYNLYSSL